MGKGCAVGAATEAVTTFWLEKYASTAVTVAIYVPLHGIPAPLL